MKIYNEIVIDMNPESSSYGETLHEDSFEYEGDMILAQGRGWTTEDQQSLDEMQELRDAFGGAWDFMAPQKMKDKYDTIVNRKAAAEEVAASGAAGEGFEGFSADEAGGFDPTFSEFQQYVEATGGYEALAKGYGVEGGDFDEFYGAPLVAMEAEYGTDIDPETGKAGTLAEGRGLDLDTIRETQRAGLTQYGGVDPVTGETITGTEQMAATEAQRAGTKALDIAGTRATEAERAGTTALDIAGTRATEGLRAATAGAKIGRRGAGLQAGQSLSNIFTQTAAQQEKGGFGPGGAASATARRAQRGVMGDYNLQQQQLAEGMTQARSAFDVSQQEITSGRKGVKSAYDTSQAEIASGRTGVTSAYDIAQKGITSGRTGLAEEGRIGKERIALAGKQAGIDWTAKKADFWKAEWDEFYDDLAGIPT